MTAASSSDLQSRVQSVRTWSRRWERERERERERLTGGCRVSLGCSRGQLQRRQRALCCHNLQQTKIWVWSLVTRRHRDESRPTESVASSAVWRELHCELWSAGLASPGPHTSLATLLSILARLDSTLYTTPWMTLTARLGEWHTDCTRLCNSHLQTSSWLCRSWDPLGPGHRSFLPEPESRSWCELTVVTPGVRMVTGSPCH